MKATLMLDRKTEHELNELSSLEHRPKSEVVRQAITEFYLKEMRAKENLLFFVDLYNKRIVTKDLLFLLLPQRDAEAIIIGSKTAQEAVEIARHLSS